MDSSEHRLDHLVGQRVHIWQPDALTSRKHIYATLERISGPAEGFPRLHLVDVVLRHPATGPVRGRDRYMDWNLNWSLEPVQSPSTSDRGRSDG